MDYSHNGTGKHRPRASHARHTSSESHRSDWDLAETFEQHPLPYRDRRRSSNNQVPDEGRMPGYYPPSPARPRRASDVPPARGHDSMPHTPQSAGPRTGRAAPGPRSRIPESSTRAPSAPRRVIEASEEDESEEETEDSDDDSDEDEQDIIPRSRAASRATSQLRRGIVSRAASPESEASKDTTLSIEIATAPRTSGPRSRPVSRAVSRVRSSRRPSFRESDADVETDSDAESGSDVSSDAPAPPHGPSQVVSRRKQIQGAPATTSALVPAKRTTPVRKQPKAAYDLDDSDCSDLERLRSRQQPPEIQIARYASPTREHRRHHSDPKRPSRKQHLSPEPRSGLRRTPASPKVYYSSQSSANNFHRSHTAPSSYVTSRSAPTRRSTSTRRSSTWIESHHTLQAEPGMNNARSVCHNCKGDEYLSRRLDCRHRLCSNCLQETFRNARGEGSAALPTCYCGQPINTEMVESVMPLKFRSRWNKHYATQMAQLRVFCPIHFCGVWIPPQSFDQKQRTGQCPQCQIHVCLACHQNMKAHKKNKGCPAVDKALLRQQKDAQTNPTRFCGRCQGAVPLSGDHPHMECDGCQTQTCAACDSKWRSCRCPWFVDERDLGLQGSQPLHRASILEPQVPEVPEIGPPPRSRRLSSSGRTNHSRTSHQHQEDRRRRQHDRAEKAFTQQILYDEPDEFGDVVAIGNIPGHFMPDDYRRGHETLIEPPSPPLHHPGVPFDRAEPGANYISGVNRARGVNGRGGSMERLAERFSEQRNGGSPAHRSTFAPMTIQPSPSVPRTMATPPLMMPMTGPPIPHLRRHHTVDDELPSPRMPIDRIPVRRRTNDFPPEEIEYPSPSSRSSRSQQSRRREPDMAHSPPAFDPANPASAQAGLTGEGRGAERVKEWRTYVEPKRRGSVTASG